MITGAACEDADDCVGFGSTSRPSNINISKISRNLIVSNTQRSSPLSKTRSIDSRICVELSISWVIGCELRQSVDKRLVIVDMDTVELRV